MYYVGKFNTLKLYSLYTYYEIVAIRYCFYKSHIIYIIVELYNKSYWTVVRYVLNKDYYFVAIPKYLVLFPENKYY